VPPDVWIRITSSGVDTKYNLTGTGNINYYNPYRKDYSIVSVDHDHVTFKIQYWDIEAYDYQGDPTPNPFNPTTVLNYSVAEPAHVKLMIYNILGRKVATIVDEDQVAGKYRKMFNASQLATGIYIERMIITDKSGKVTQLTKKLLLMK